MLWTMHVVNTLLTPLQILETYLSTLSKSTRTQVTTHQAIIATQGHKLSYLISYIYIDSKWWGRSDLAISTQGSSAMPYRDTSLAIQQTIYWSQMMGTVWPGYINTGCQCYAIQGHKASYTTSYIYWSQMMGTITISQ